MVHVCLRYLLWEFHYSRFCLCHENDKRFSDTPVSCVKMIRPLISQYIYIYLIFFYCLLPLQWLPAKWYFQWLYLLYRWIVFIFFLAYLIQTGIASVSSGPRFFIFLTNWSLLTLTFHLLWSATFVTIRYFQVHIFCRKTFEVNRECEKHPYRLYDKPVGCCGVHEDSTLWYQKVQWLLFTIGNGSAIAVTILYWSLIYRPRDGGPNHINLVIHAINGIVGLLDIWVSGIPVRILHFIYLFIFCCTYGVFTGIYFAAGGINHLGMNFIYPVLNYEDAPGTAAAYLLGTALVFIPLLHLFIWGVYLLREGLLYLIKHVCLKGNRSTSDGGPDRKELGEEAKL